MCRRLAYSGLKGAWREVPEATCAVISGGRDELRPFTPTPT